MSQHKKYNIKNTTTTNHENIQHDKYNTIFLLFRSAFCFYPYVCCNFVSVYFLSDLTCDVIACVISIFSTVDVSSLLRIPLQHKKCNIKIQHAYNTFMQHAYNTEFIKHKKIQHKVGVLGAGLDSLLLYLR